MLRLALAAVASVLWACADPTAPLEPTFAYTCDPTLGPNRTQARLQPLRTRTRTLRSSDQVFADITRKVPGGWGGYFFDFEDGTYTTYLVDPSKAVEATAALLELGIHIRQARVKQGLWDFAQLYDWQLYIYAESGAPQYISTNIDQALNRVVFGVKDVATGDSLATFFSSLVLPCDLLVIELASIMVGA